jgi:hypothetical protein
VIGVAGVIVGGGDGDAAGWRKETFWFAEVVAERVIDGLMNGVVFIGLEKLSGEILRHTD